MAALAETVSDSDVAQRILRAAVGFFASKGFAATSTNEIVEAAGVTKPMLYYYFGSKEGLWRAVLTWYLDDARRRQTRPLGSALSPMEELVEFVWTAFAIYRENPDFLRLLHVMLHGPKGEAPGVDLSGFQLQARALFRQAAARACRSGLARPGSEEPLARALLGVVTAWTLFTPEVDGVELTRSLAASIVRDLLRGYGASNTDH